MNIRKIKNRIFLIINKSKRSDWISKIYSLFMEIVVVLNIGSIILETFNYTNLTNLNEIRTFELVCIAIFLIDYLLHLWTANILYRNLTPFKAKIKYVVSPIAIIDLISILPLFLYNYINYHQNIFLITKLAQLLRLLKLTRYLDPFKQIVTVLKNKALSLVYSMSILIILFIISSVLMFYIENPVQPEVFKNIYSSMWLSIASITTIGYGDIYPITNLGKLVGSIINILGIFVFALPTSIISAGFVEDIHKKRDMEKAAKAFCPHCGERLE